ncbi:hypothetical protein PQI07_19035 [Methylobacterium sp. 092160098-2]|uniref:hypothetical protein n=1 Tax=Methylobacterium sp. 092160098-2 TaxID=3025129 RepID=UPI002381BB86|nr:hypothetical protein [Methylobacterium sp. 092160098-2]MDE4912781.1 hypothetical protein [Methylobacterium sp. 092160098-2]
MSPDPGRIAYEARFAHARPREFDPWDSLAPEVQAIWVRVECAVLDAAGSGIHPGQAREAADDPGQPSTVSTAAIVPSVVAGETFVAIQDEHVQLLQRIDRGPFFVPLLERAYVKLIPWNGDTLIPRLVSCGWAEMAPRESRAVRITDAGRRALADFEEARLKELGGSSAA